MNNQENSSLGVLRGAKLIAEVIGLSTRLTIEMINKGEIPGTMTGGDLRTFTTTREALKKHFDSLTTATREDRRRAGITKAEAKEARRHMKNLEIQAQMKRILDGVDLVQPTPAPADAEEHAEASP